MSHESIAPDTCAARLVRRWRLLLWRSRHRWRRAWPDSGDMPYHLFHGRIPHEKLTGYVYETLKWSHNQSVVMAFLRCFSCWLKTISCANSETNSLTSV